MSAPVARKVTEVAVGVLSRPDEAVLLADRPSGKPYAGFWEFPGGKIEPGESVEHALARELHEELGVDIGPVRPWVTFEFDYPHAYVRLHFCRVFDWRGTPHGREGQRLAFFRLDENPPQPLLPAAEPALRWLRLPPLAAEALIDPGEPEAASRLMEQVDAALARGVRLLLLRAAAVPTPRSMPSAHLVDVVASIVARTQAHGARVIVDGELSAMRCVGLDGCHLSARSLSAADIRPPGDWIGADVGSRPALERAARLGFDYALAAPVLPDLAVASTSPVLGWHGFEALARSTPLPVFAGGGLCAGDLDRAQAAGAHGLVLPLASWANSRIAAR